MLDSKHPFVQAESPSDEPAVRVRGLDYARAGQPLESTAEMRLRMSLIETLVMAFLEAEETS